MTEYDATEEAYKNGYNDALNKVIVVKYPYGGDLNVDEIKELFDETKDAYPNNKVLFIPDLITIKEVDKNELKEMLKLFEEFVNEVVGE